MVRRLLLLLVLVPVFLSTAGALAAMGSDLESGRAAYQAGDLSAARRFFTAAAETGDMQGQFLAGQMLAQGQGGPKDIPSALRWLEAAATRGHLQAMVTAGTIYAYGDGIAANYPRAFALLKPAAEAGDPHAQNNLAVLFHFGLGTAKNPVQAMAWALRAERQGLLSAITLRQEIETGLTLAQKSDALRTAGLPLSAARPTVPAPLPAPPATATRPRAAEAAPPREPPISASPAPAPAPMAPIETVATPQPTPTQTPVAQSQVSPPPSAPPAGSWAVQVAALPSEAEARREWQVIAAKSAEALAGLAPAFVPVDVAGKGVFTRILVGTFPNAKAAEQLCQRLKAAGQDCLIRRL